VASGLIPDDVGDQFLEKRAFVSDDKKTGVLSAEHALAIEPAKLGWHQIRSFQPTAYP
jgi:hypothetical protein